METSAGRLTPFMLFYTEHRDAVKARINQAAAKPEDISKEITRLWRSLAPERTRDYCLLSNLYAESLAKHGRAARVARSSRHSSNTTNNTTNSSSSNHNNNKRKLGKQPRRKKDPRLPKPPVSSFMWFSRHHRAILKNEHRELSFCEIGKTVGALWKAAAAVEKRPFDDLATEDKTRYARELAEYEVWLVKAQGSKDGEEERPAAAASATIAAGAAAAAAAAVAGAMPPSSRRSSTSSFAPSSPSPSLPSPTATAAAASVAVATPAAAAAVAAAAAAASVAPVPVVSPCAPSVPENKRSNAAVGVSVSPQGRFAPHPSFLPSYPPSEYSQQMVPMHPHKRLRREREEPPRAAATLAALPMSRESVLDVVTDMGGATAHMSHRQHVGVKAENVVMVSRSPHAHYSV